MAQPQLLSSWNPATFDRFGSPLQGDQVKQEHAYRSMMDDFDPHHLAGPYGGLGLASEAELGFSTDEQASLAGMSHMPLFSHINPASLTSIGIPSSLTALSIDTDVHSAHNMSSAGSFGFSSFPDSGHHFGQEDLSPQSPWLDEHSKRKESPSDNVVAEGTRKDSSSTGDSKDNAKRRRKSSAESRRMSQASSKDARRASITEESRENGSGDEVKREKFLERNRVAASKCRQKKKVWTAQLEERLRELTAEQTQLNAARNVLKFDLLNLKNQLLQHVNCDCVGIRQYLAQTISQQAPHTAVYKMADGEGSSESSKFGHRRSTTSDMSSSGSSYPSSNSLSPSDALFGMTNLDAWHSPNCSQRAKLEQVQATLDTMQDSTELLTHKSGAEHSGEEQ